MSTDCTTHPTTLAKPIAPDDLQRGEYVAVLNIEYEYPSWFWCCDSGLMPPDEPVRITLRPRAEEGEPLKIVALCLPFIFVKRSNGGHRTLDIRGCQLARLDGDYAQMAWKGLKQKRRKKKK